MPRLPRSRDRRKAIVRLLEPQTPGHLGALIAAGVVGYIGNMIAARIRTRAGQRLDSLALVADGEHARVDALVSEPEDDPASFEDVRLDRPA
jgi:divalent metal cation (Fe/Co/Zn/Cd) transporter